MVTDDKKKAPANRNLPELKDKTTSYSQIAGQSRANNNANDYVIGV